MYTGLSWTPSPRKPAESKPNLGQLYLSRLSLAKPAKLHFFKTPASDVSIVGIPILWLFLKCSERRKTKIEEKEIIQ